MMKKQNHNIYDLNETVYRFIISVCIVLWVLLFFDIKIHQFSILTQISIWTVALVIFVPLMAFMKKRGKNNITPYSRKDRFEFLGLYNLKDSNVHNGNDIFRVCTNAPLNASEGCIVSKLESLAISS